MVKKGEDNMIYKNYRGGYCYLNKVPSTKAVSAYENMEKLVW